MGTQVKSNKVIGQDYVEENTEAMSQVRLRIKFVFSFIQRIARPLRFVIVGLIGMYLWQPVLAFNTIELVSGNIIHILPFIVGSAVLAGYLDASSADQLIGKVFSQRVWIAIIFAAIFGAFSPFCSCGVIPLIAALMASGVPLAAIMAFWISSPVMDPAMFIVTSGGISFEFAVIKTISAMALGIFAGASTQLLVSQGRFNSPSKLNTLSECASNKAHFSSPVWKIWHDAPRLYLLRKKTVTMTLFLMKWLTFAYFLESVMITFISASTISTWLSGGSLWTVMSAAVLGVPAYLNGFAAVPLVSGLIDSGLSEGAGLAFMLAGSITSIPAAIAVFSLVRKPVFVWYLVLAVTGSILAGLVVNLWYSV